MEHPYCNEETGMVAGCKNYRMTLYKEWELIGLYCIVPLARDSRGKANKYMARFK